LRSKYVGLLSPAGASCADVCGPEPYGQVAASGSAADVVHEAAHDPYLLRTEIAVAFAFLVAQPCRRAQSRFLQTFDRVDAGKTLLAI
jgi:hypothetical protein